MHFDFIIRWPDEDPTIEEEFCPEKCVICLEGFEPSKPEVNVFKKGLSTLMRISRKRGKNHLLRHLKITRELNGKVLVHSDCRRKFTDKRKKRPSNDCRKRLRSSLDAPMFDWKDSCFLCSQKIVWKRCDREPFYEVRTKPVRDSLIARAKERKDDWGDQVLGRLLTCNDLIAEEAVYHQNCMNRFRINRLNANTGKKGRPVNTPMMKAYERVCYWLENETDCELYTLQELHEKMVSFADGGEVYTVKTLKQKLKESYKEYIYFSQLPGRENVICFRNMADKVLYDMKKKAQQTKEDVLMAAAKIVKADLQALDKTTEFYPSVNDIKDGNNEEWVPKSLSIFLDTLISSTLKKKSLGQCISQASRPRSMMCPLVFGLGVELDKTFGSMWLTNHLSRFGYCISYDEVQRFKMSSIESEKVIDEIPEFMQWVADNVDHNLVTLTGKGTFHGMGIISATQPAVQIRENHKVLRLKQRKKVSEVNNNKGIELHHFIGSSSRGLSKLVLTSIRQLKTNPTLSKEVNYDILWHASWFSSSLENPRPNWNGFMQCATKDTPAEENSTITFLPIIDLNSSDESCIYSTLLFIIKQAKSLNVMVPSVTFDQPLWLKATGIIKEAKLEIVCRLGGFHTLMSFIGSVGHLMKGSGLEELFSQVYAEHTVVHMVSGKAISRALRAHLLAESSLVTLLTEDIAGDFDFNFEFEDNKELEEKLNSDEIAMFRKEFEQKTSSLSNKSRTAKLWVLYLNYITTIKKYIVAERTSNWYLHLEATKEMLNLFAATGHINYAKSARLYVQQMIDLQNSNPWLHHKFEQGMHAIRRSNRNWAGLWPDLVIEQTLMRSIKTRGGLTRGRGMTDDVRNLWVLSLSDCASIHQAMTDVSGLTVKSSEQHVEMGMARRTKDHADCKIFLDWLQQRNPFAYEDSDLHSISLGLVSDGKDGINCDNAEEVGETIQTSLDNLTITECSIKRKDQIKPMLALQDQIKVGKESIIVNPTLLFTRLVAIAQRDKEDIEDYFAFELTQEPMSLFKHGLMRKPDKPSLRKVVMPDNEALGRDKLPSDPVFVIDGGALLHRLREWSKDSTFDELCQAYCRYVRRHYKSCIIVFDGYDGPSTKSSEHMRRTGGGKRCPNVDVVGCNKVSFDQERFLSNENNKSSFIKLLGTRLEQDGQTVKICRGDADPTVVAITLREAEATTKGVVTVADDTDIAIMLLYHWEEKHKHVYFFQESANKAWNMKDYCPRWSSVKEHILFIHAFSGCDTTSAPYGRGKAGLLSLVSKNKELQLASETICDVWAEGKEVGEAAIQAFQIIYSGKDEASLCKLRLVFYFFNYNNNFAQRYFKRIF